MLGKTECQNSQGRGDSGVRTTWLDTEQVRPLLPGADSGQGGAGGGAAGASCAGPRPLPLVLAEEPKQLRLQVL